MSVWMTQAQAEKAIQRLYENEGLRGELTDDEAQILLEWGEAQTAEIAGRGLSDELFDAEFGNLSRLIGRINQFIGKREGMTAEAQQAALAELATLAETMHFKIARGKVESYAKEHSKLANPEALQALIALMKPPAPESDSESDVLQ